MRTLPLVLAAGLAAAWPCRAWGDEADLTAPGIFSEDAARTLLDLLEREADPGPRGEGARTFYLLFYDKRGLEAEILSFLADPRVSGAIRRLLVSDPQIEVRRNMAHLAQIITFGFPAASAERLAQAYVPALIEALGDPDESQRNEVLVALGNFRETAFFKSPEAQQALRRRLGTETDPDLTEQLGELLSREPGSPNPRHAVLLRSDELALRVPVGMPGERLFDGAGIGGGRVLEAVPAGTWATGPETEPGLIGGPSSPVPPGAPAAEASPPTLSQKAELFQKRVEQALNPFGLVGDSDDALIWTGIYVGSQAQRYAATRDPEALRNMEDSLRGLHALHEVTGIPGLVARNILPLPPGDAPMPGNGHRASGRYEGYQWKGRLSWDQYLGYLYGVSEAWPHIQDPRLRAQIREDVRQVARHFMENDGKIEGLDTYLDSSPRYYYQDRWPKFLRRALGWIGYLLPSRGGNPMHGLHLMQAASYITGDPEIVRYYRETMIQEKDYPWYVRNRTQGRTETSVRRWSWLLDAAAKLVYGWKHGFGIKATPDSLRAPVGLNLGHIALYDLARLEQDPETRSSYLDGLKGTHEAVARHANTFWNFLYAAQLGDDPAAVPEGLDSLGRFPLEDYEVRNSDDPALRKYKGVHNNFFKSKRPWEWYSTEPLPFERRSMHSFAWQQNAMTLDGGYHAGDTPGVAYLAAYWLGRKQGFIDEDR